MDNVRIGKNIALLRSAKGFTQTELGDRVGVSFQAVSKWERGEGLPDISVLPLLSEVLETSVDNLLSDGNNVCFKGRKQVADIIEGVRCLKRMGELLGKDNLLYLQAVDGINKGMNTDISGAFYDERIFEAFVSEAVISVLRSGYYVDITDIKRSFKLEHFRNIVLDYAKKTRYKIRDKRFALLFLPGMLLFKHKEGGKNEACSLYSCSLL